MDSQNHLYEKFIMTVLSIYNMPKRTDKLWNE
jgi:hypothetical protein